MGLEVKSKQLAIEINKSDLEVLGAGASEESQEEAVEAEVRGSKQGAERPERCQARHHRV